MAFIAILFLADFVGSAFMDTVNIAIYIAWNENGYKYPSGKCAKSVNSPDGESKGFGFEEWNNSAENIVTIKDAKYRVFYSVADVHFEKNKTYNVYFWSSQRSAYLLGYALNFNQTSPAIRKKFSKQLDINKRVDLTWLVPNVIKYFKKKELLSKDINQYSDSFAKYQCLNEDFFWFDTPKKIDEYMLGVDGKKPAKRYPNAQEIDNEQVEYFKNIIAQNAIADLDNISCLTKSEKEAVAKVRLSQGKFRKDILSKWDNKCAVSGISFEPMLIASHIKPWSLSNDSERNDANNGLLLSRNIDALFDKYLISFDANGKVIISTNIPENIVDVLGIRSFHLSKRPTENQLKYLQEHTQELKVRQGNG